MPSATPHALSEDDIDDLLFSARTGSLPDLRDSLSRLSTQSLPLPALLTLAIDPDSGNGLLHMAAANGHTDIIHHILSLAVSSADLLAMKNQVGNTPLHYASVSGQLEAVKILIAASADPCVKNDAGHDALYEAERAEKTEVVEYLLKECKGLEIGVGTSDGSGERDAGENEEVTAEVETNGEKVANDMQDQDEIQELEKGVEALSTTGTKP